MLRKILEKVFITNKFTQYKTSHILKIVVFEIPGNRNTGNLFSKYELLFLDQANSSSDSSQILILQFTIPRASLCSTPYLSNFSLANSNSSSTQSSSYSSLVSFFIIFLIVFLIQPHASTSNEYTKPYAKRSQWNLILSYIQS